jgi:hypothetical protein
MWRGGGGDRFITSKLTAVKLLSSTFQYDESVTYNTDATAMQCVWCSAPVVTIVRYVNVMSVSDNCLRCT